MGRKKKYANAAAKQKAWRQRHGQKEKVPLPIRVGEKLGTSEALLREKKEGESWEEYSKYLKTRVGKARGFKSEQIPIEGEGVESPGAKRAFGKYKEPSMGEEYYERQREHELSLVEAKGNRIKKRRKRKE